MERKVSRVPSSQMRFLRRNWIWMRNMRKSFEWCVDLELSGKTEVDVISVVLNQGWKKKLKRAKVKRNDENVKIKKKMLKNHLKSDPNGIASLIFSSKSIQTQVMLKTSRGHLTKPIPMLIFTEFVFNQHPMGMFVVISSVLILCVIKCECQQHNTHARAF